MVHQATSTATPKPSELRKQFPAVTTIVTARRDAGELEQSRTTFEHLDPAEFERRKSEQILKLLRWSATIAAAGESEVSR